MAQAPTSFLADGFSDDCDMLIHQCLLDTPVTFQSFATVFRRLQMSCLFHDRQSGAEIAELSEEVINIAKHYMLANTDNFEESVVGLFLVYAMLHVQPFKNFAHLRVVEADVPFIERLEQKARRDKRHDVLYVLGSVLVEHTRYFAVSRERGMEPAFRKYLEGCATVDNLGVRPKGVFLRQNEELDIITELRELQLQYDIAKAAVKDANLKYTDSKFAESLDTSLKNVISGIHEEKDDIQDTEEDDAYRARSIKEKAMKTKVNPIKHLMGVQERSPPKPAQSPKPIKSSPHNVDVTSPVQKPPPISTITKPPTRTKRKRSTSESNDSSQESDKSIQLSDHDSDGDDIDLDHFDQVKQPDNEQVIPSNQINFEALPPVMTTEDKDRTYRIEVVDKLNSTNDRENLEGDANAPKQIHFIEVVDKTNTKVIERKDKRDLKKTILKSRFKRLGIEPIADFKSS